MGAIQTAEQPVLLTKSDVAGLLQISTRQVENLVRAGRIPGPLYLSRQSPRWRLAEVLEALGIAAGVRP
jgi:predicted DNA-binding transcriptional regulator AlpA